MPIPKAAYLATLPPEWPEDLLPSIQAMVNTAGTKLVVLDDDPTGCQTVHDVAVYTEWSVTALTAALHEPGTVAYILTNSRSVPLPAAQAINREIATHLQAASRSVGRDYAVVSRSDSTLRGHYPGETQALSDALGNPFDATLIIPFFGEGGRLTIGDIHYVAEGDSLTPAAETVYAQDAVFGYAHSDLRAWVSEKHGASLAPDDVASLTLDDVRQGGPEAITAKLLSLSRHTVCIANAASYRDLEVIVAGLLAAEARGKRYLYRTAASFVRVRGGIEPRPLLQHGELASGRATTGGVVVVGSHIPKTTQQIAAALTLPSLCAVELPVRPILDPASRSAEIARSITAIDAALESGEDVLVYTSRELVRETPTLDTLEVGQQVSRVLVAVVRGLHTRPAWLITKGGITSSDIATSGLGVTRALVLGQAIAGVPIWRTGPESRWPGLTYVVFPGNVGSDSALAEMIEILRGTATQGSG